MRIRRYFDGTPRTVRFSSVVRTLRNDGHPRDAALVEYAKERYGATCPAHGELKDPIVAIDGTQIAFACPWCSSPTMLALWEAEK